MADARNECLKSCLHLGTKDGQNGKDEETSFGGHSPFVSRSRCGHVTGKLKYHYSQTQKKKGQWHGVTVLKIVELVLERRPPALQFSISKEENMSQEEDIRYDLQYRVSTSGNPANY
ncbi:hypothetical protein EK904_009576 [Melospiza melodia maxima]|nr:hypothetical protein EK904_009576 [Melospiza melodia maxima]